MAKIQPAPLTMSFNVAQPPNSAGSYTLDISQCASLMNRRFYRQGLNWAVAGVKVVVAPESLGQMSIEKIPSTWMASNAWQKAYSAWQKQTHEALDDSHSESAVARYRDFKVHMDTLHVDAGFAQNLLPIFHTLSGEWQPSEIVIPNVMPDASGSLVDPQEYQLHMVGVNNHLGVSRGIIEGYADSRAFPQSPDPTPHPDIPNPDNWLREMFDVGDDTSEVVNNATNVNNNLPYPQIEYPAGEVQAPYLMLHDISGISSTTVNGIVRFKGGAFPAGLMRLIIDNQKEGTMHLLVQVELMAGPSKGYLTQPLKEW